MLQRSIKKMFKIAQDSNQGCTCTVHVNALSQVITHFSRLLKYCKWPQNELKKQCPGLFSSDVCFTFDKKTYGKKLSPPSAKRETKEYMYLSRIVTGNRHKEKQEKECCLKNVIFWLYSLYSYYYLRIP